MIRRVGFIALSLIVHLSAMAETRVGLLYGVTGMGADLGTQMQRGAEFYQATVKHSNLELFFEDSRWDAGASVAALHELIAAHQIQILHVLGSGPSLAVKPIAESHGIGLFSAAAHPDLLSRPLIVRHGNLATEDAAILANFLGTYKAVQPIGSIFVQNDWGEVYNQTLERLLKENGIQFFSEPHLPGDQDFRPEILRLLKRKPNSVVINTFGAAVSAIPRRLRELGFNGTIYFNNGLALSKSAQMELKKFPLGMAFYQRYPALPPEFIAAYRAWRAEEPGYFSLISYTDLELIDNASRSNGELSGAKIIEAVKRQRVFQGRFSELTITLTGDIIVPTYMERLE